MYAEELGSLSGRDLDEAAQSFGIMRQPQESDVLFRLRLQAAAYKKEDAVYSAQRCLEMYQDTAAKEMQHRIMAQGGGGQPWPSQGLAGMRPGQIIRDDIRWPAQTRTVQTPVERTIAVVLVGDQYEVHIDGLAVFQAVDQQDAQDVADHLGAVGAGVSLAREAEETSAERSRRGAIEAEKIAQDRDSAISQQLQSIHAQRQMAVAEAEMRQRGDLTFAHNAANPPNYALGMLAQRQAYPTLPERKLTSDTADALAYSLKLRKWWP